MGEGDDTSQDDDKNQDEGEIQVRQVTDWLEDVGHDTEDTTNPKHDGKPVGDFLEESDPCWSLFFFGKFIVTLFEISLYGHLGGESGLEVGTESVEEFFKRDFVFIHALDVIGFLILFFPIDFFLVFRGN